MKKILLSILAVLLVVALAARLALPYLAKRRINEALAGLEGFRGRVEKVQISLILGRFTLRSLELWDAKKDLQLEVPRLSADLA